VEILPEQVGSPPRRATKIAINLFVRRFAHHFIRRSHFTGQKKSLPGVLSIPQHMSAAVIATRAGAAKIATRRDCGTEHLGAWCTAFGMMPQARLSARAV
jgi:hypothetical protein